MIKLSKATLVAVLLIGSGPAYAACSLDRSLAALLAAPSNVEVSLEHAKCAVEVGDIEAAISTLEGLLIYAPNNPALEIEIAGLYARIGAKSLAAAHYESVLETGGLADTEKQAATLGLASLTAQSNTGWSFKNYTAWRYQNNANLGLSSSTVFINNNFVMVPNNQRRQPDHSIWTEGGVTGRFGQGGGINAWELNADWFVNRQRKAFPLDSVLLDANFGPEFSVASNMVDVRPYLIGSLAWLQDAPLYQSYGAGFSAAGRVDENTTWQTRTDYRVMHYDNNTLRPTASTFDGYQVSGLFEVAHLVSETLELSLKANAIRVDLRDDEYSYHGFGASAGVVWVSGFDPFSAGPVSAEFTAGYQFRRYDGPWTSVNLAKRDDHEINLSFEVDVPITKNVSFVPRFEYDRVRSDFPISTYEALTTYAGLRVSY